MAINFIVGVTGGIGSGKTAATDHFASLGIQVVDADLVARKVVEPGSVALNEIRSQFGEEYISSNGELDRAKLRSAIFTDFNLKERLNQIMQPAIRGELISQLELAQSEYVILSAPLLFENGLEAYCDRTLVIDVPEAIQKSRATKRDGVSAQQIQAIIDAQMSRDARVKKADDVIVNDKSLEALNSQIDQLHKKYLTLARG